MFTFTPSYAIENAIYLPEGTPMPERDINEDGSIDKNDVIIDETEENFYEYQHFDEPLKKEESSLLKKIDESIHAKVERNDYSNYLFKDILTYDFERGPLDKIQFYGKYRGNLSLDFSENDTDLTYDNRSIDVGMIGEFNKLSETDFKLQFKLTPTRNRTFFQQLISDAYIVNRNIPHHQIFIGNSRNQVGVEGGMSSTLVPFITRSQIARNFGNTRAFGVRITGKYSLIDYSLAANSSDRYFKEFFPGAEFTGWVNIKPLGLANGKYGKLVIGTGISTGKNRNSYTVGGVYAGYTYKNFMINAEYSRANGYNGTSFSTNNAQGFYSTIGYNVHPKVQVVGRVDCFDPNLEKSGDVRTEYSAGINYFIIGQGLKLMINYVFCNYQNMPNSHRLIIGTQILL